AGATARRGPGTGSGPGHRAAAAGGTGSAVGDRGTGGVDVPPCPAGRVERVPGAVRRLHLPRRAAAIRARPRVAGPAAVPGLPRLAVHSGRWARRAVLA